MKLFGKGGKFNIIDIIIVVILIAAIVFAVVHFATKSDDLEDPEVTEEDVIEKKPRIRFTVSFKDLPGDLAENVIDALEGEDITVGDNKVSATRITNDRKLVPAEAVSWKATACGSVNRMDLQITVDGRAEDMESYYRLGTQELRLGRDYIFKTLTVELKGVITQMEVFSE